MNFKSNNNHHSAILLPTGKLYIITNIGHLAGYCYQDKIKILQQNANKPMLLLKDINTPYSDRHLYKTTFLINNINVEFISYTSFDNFRYSFSREKFLNTIQQI